VVLVAVAEAANKVSRSKKNSVLTAQALQGIIFFIPKEIFP